jgi:putative Mn2+ efflux pump MntP
LNYIYVLATALALALDAFTVAVGLSLSRAGLNRRQVFRLSFSFGIFQSGMALLGFLAGQTVSAQIASWDHWIAFGLLLFVGLKMIVEAFHPQRNIEKKETDPTRGSMLLFLSLATSVDAFAVGLGLAVLEVEIFVTALVIGGVAFVLSCLGAGLGRLLGRITGKVAPILGGIMLILIGVKILIDHI